MSPETLSVHQRRSFVLSTLGALAAHSDARFAWLGQRLLVAIESDATLAQAFGLQASRSLQTTLTRERADVLMARLASICGGDKLASEVLLERARAPVAAIEVVRELSRLPTGRTVLAFKRARQRIRSKRSS